MKKWNINYRLFIVTFFVTVYVLFAYAFIAGEEALKNTDKQIEHTYRVIQEAGSVATLAEGMLASQRGYILTGNQDFLDEYARRKNELLDHMLKMADLTRGNPTQTVRLENLQREIENFARELEKRAEAFRGDEMHDEMLEGVAEVNRMKDGILTINNNALAEEYRILDERISAIEGKRGQYYKTITVGGTLATVAIVAFNLLVLQALTRQATAENTLRVTEERLKLAIEGTNDGIFDWNIDLDTVFYSRQFYTLLGEDRDARIGTIEEFRERMHPEDAEKVMRHIEHYLGGELSEYEATFRLRHGSGRWIWVTSKAKAIFDEHGKPLRMVGAVTDVTHLYEQQERLKQEKNAAEEASKAKTEFLAHMSHEIRTPLTAISGIAEIFQNRQDNLDEKQRQLARTLLSSTSALKDLVNDLLDFSRIESGELEFDEKNVLLDGFFENIISLMSVTAAEKGLEFSLDYRPVEGRYIQADDLRLRQVLVNLIGNAIKFTEKGSVTVGVSEDMRDGVRCLRIEVRDTGIGIAREDFERIFERFRQVDAGISRKYGGTGLGLSISRKLVSMMNGAILLDSTPGKGSVFTVLVPWREERLPVTGGAAGPKAGGRADARLQKEDRVLVVEDYEGNIVVVSYIMDELGCSYDVAHNGEEALEMWKEKHYDAILMDVQMPGMDGFAATRAIRQIEHDKKLPRTPVIGMTAHALVNDKDKCIEAGMDAYLSKPLVEADLKKTVLRYVRESRKAA